MPDKHLDAETGIIAKGGNCSAGAVDATRAFSLHEIGGLELPPGAVANREYPHCLPTFVEFIDDTVDVRLFAVEQVPQLSL